MVLESDAIFLRQKEEQPANPLARRNPSYDSPKIFITSVIAPPFP